MKFDVAFHLLALKSENDFIMQIIIVEEKSERVELHAEKRPPVDMAHLRYGLDDMAHGAVYMGQPVGRYGPAIMDQELQ